MNIPSSYINLPQGYAANDLGDAGNLVEPAGIQPDCFLISHSTSPIYTGYSNDYVVIVNDSIKDKITEIKWQYKIYNGAAMQMPNVSDNRMYASPTWKETGAHTIIVELYGAAGIFRTLQIRQTILPQSSILRGFTQYAQKTISNLGNPEITTRIIGCDLSYIRQAYAAITSDKKVPLRLFMALIYWYSVKYQSPSLLFSLPICVKAAGAYRKNTSPEIAYIPWSTIHYLPKADVRTAISPLQASFDSLSSSDRQDVDLLTSRRKTGVQVMYRILNSIKNQSDHYSSIVTEDFISHYVAVGDVVQDFLFLLSLEDVRLNINEELSNIRNLLFPSYQNLMDILLDLDATQVDCFASDEEGTSRHRITSVKHPALLPYNSELIDKDVHYQQSTSSPINKSWLNGTNEFILMDVGYWGTFHTGVPQRNFGMIDGSSAWLCNLSSESVRPERLACNIMDSGSLARAFVQSLTDDWFYNVEILGHANINQMPNQSGTLTIILPDLHLPEKLPDIPKIRYSGANYEEYRSILRKGLLLSQRKGYSIDYDDVSIHNHFHQALSEDSALNIQYYASYGKHRIGQGPNFPIITNTGTAFFSANEFNAEKDLLDRALRINSMWFYQPQRYSDNLFCSILSGEELPNEVLKCEANSAIDLSVLLLSINKMSVNKNINVIQVGDLFEMWMGKEWLYLPFGEYSSDIENIISDECDSVVLDSFLRTLLLRTLPDSYQFRLDPDWDIVFPDPLDSFPDLKKLREINIPTNQSIYIFHEWPKTKRDKRRYIGNDLLAANKTPPRGVDRAKAAVSRRIQAILDFVLPVPVHWNFTQCSAFTKIMNLSRLDSQPDQFGATEYKWNKKILDLLLATEFNGSPLKKKCTILYGNHDGYIGDKMLISPEWDAKLHASPYVNENGIWAEHGHRWDLYNLDGMPFGPAITNMVYYYWRPFIEQETNLLSQVIPPLHFLPDQFFEGTLPGCAEWFLRVKNGTINKTGSAKESPFHIMVIGHSHTPRLVRASIAEKID